MVTIENNTGRSYRVHYAIGDVSNKYDPKNVCMPFVMLKNGINHLTDEEWGYIENHNMVKRLQDANTTAIIVQKKSSQKKEDNTYVTMSEVPTAQKKVIVTKQKSKS